jgi:primosomal protein N'
MPNCPRCLTPMTGGAPHDEAYSYQLECHSCGYIQPVYRSQEDLRDEPRK